MPLRRHLSFANVMSCIAVFIALATGGAYAANTVFSTDIVDGEVKSADIGDDEIRSRDVLNETLTSGDVLNNSLRAADIGPDEIGISEIDESALTDLGTGSFAEATREGCDPSTATHVECGTERLEVTLDAPSDVVVFAEGSWFGNGAGGHSGECRVEGDGLTGGDHKYGQILDYPHLASDYGGPISQVSAFQSLDAGTYEFWFACKEIDANFVVDWVDLTAIRVGAG